MDEEGVHSLDVARSGGGEGGEGDGDVIGSTRTIRQSHQRRLEDRREVGHWWGRRRRRNRVRGEQFDLGQRLDSYS